MKTKSALGISAAALALFIFLDSCKTTHPVKDVQTSRVNASPAVHEKGKKIASIACGPCHFDQASNTLAGAQMLDLPSVLGKVYASSLTKHPENEITKYTDGQLRYLLRTGIKKDGKMAAFMQKPNMSDEDMDALIAFLRSDDPMVQPVAANAPRTDYSKIGAMAMNGQKTLPYPENKINGPHKSDKVAYGKYLIDIIGCYDCHSASFMKLDKMNPENSKGYMGGGTKMLGADGKKIFTSNLTFHKTGIEGWSVEDFGKAVRQGISKDNSVIRYPMRMFTDLDDKDIDAIYAYLKTIPPIDNQVKDTKSKKKE